MRARAHPLWAIVDISAEGSASDPVFRYHIAPPYPEETVRDVIEETAYPAEVTPPAAEYDLQGRLTAQVLDERLDLPEEPGVVRRLRTELARLEPRRPRIAALLEEEAFAGAILAEANIARINPNITVETVSDAVAWVDDILQRIAPPAIHRGVQAAPPRRGRRCCPG